MAPRKTRAAADKPKKTAPASGVKKANPKTRSTKDTPAATSTATKPKQILKLRCVKTALQEMDNGSNSSVAGQQAPITTQDAASTAPVLTAATNTKRTQTKSACLTCRTRKLKCSGDRPSCTHCIQRSITCQYDVNKGETRDEMLKRTITELQAKIVEHQTTIAEHEDTIAELHTTISEQQTKIAEQQTTIAEEQTTIAEQQATIVKQEATDITRRQAIVECHAALDSQLMRPPPTPSSYTLVFHGSIQLDLNRKNALAQVYIHNDHLAAIETELNAMRPLPKVVFR